MGIIIFWEAETKKGRSMSGLFRHWTGGSQHFVRS